MHITQNFFLKTALKPLIYIIKWFGRNYPETLVKIRYFVRFRKRLNLNKPKTLNEKILYLSLRTDTHIRTKLTDKWKVREYVKECGLEKILVKLYGVWKNAKDIDFTALPNSFVLKSNHGSGNIILVKEKTILDKELVISQINKDLSQKYGELEGGRHYYDITPVVIAEEFLKNDKVSKKYSSSIIDYKIWCFNGKPYFIWTCCNRDKNGTDVMTYDLNWDAHPEYSVFNKGYRKSNNIPKPINIEEMLETAEKLAKPFPCVRVDLYNINGKIYFREMTFTSLGGLMDFYSDEFQLMAGSMIDLNYRG